MEKTLSLLLVFRAIILTSAVDSCPYNVTACKCDTNLLKCDNLNSIPPLVSNNPNGSITILQFWKGNLKDVPENSLPPNLIIIFFDSVPVTYISPDAFNGSSTTLRSLRMMDTTYNQVPTALLHVNNLTRLEFIDTQIAVWNSTVMMHLAKTVRTLSLENVGIVTWPNYFEYFELLTYVDLSNNKIGSIPKAAFNKQSSLTTLWLSGNQLNNVTNLDDALRSVSSTLENLYIGENMLSSIPSSVANITGLSKLDLYYSKIEDLTNGIPPQLKYLGLGLNNIKKLTDTFFINATSLEILKLYSNPITEISRLAFLPLQNLQELDLYSISLTTIPVALTSLKKLKTLNLGPNFYCPCPRNGDLFHWYNSLNISISGTCNGRRITIDQYFHNDTYIKLCSGNNNLNYSVYFYFVVIALFSLTIL